MTSHYQNLWPHDDVIKWKHCPRYWPFMWGIHWPPVNSPHKGQWHRALMFSLICVWINGWENNCEAGDLRRYPAHYDVTVMNFADIMYATRPQWIEGNILSSASASNQHFTDGIFKCIFFNTLRWRQNGCCSADDIFKCVLWNENIWISIKISLFAPQGLINNIPTLVQIMA